MDNLAAENPIVQEYTRSLKRRLVAFLIDYFAMAIIFAILTIPLAYSLSSPFRGGFNILYFSSCSPGDVYSAEGAMISKEGWTTIEICDVKRNLFFPVRTVTFKSPTTSQNSNTISPSRTFITFQLNDQNRVVAPTALTPWLWLFFVLVSAWSENRFGWTIGKYTVWLSVSDQLGNKPKIKTTLLRNTLKFFPALLPLVAMPFEIALLGWASPSQFITKNNTVELLAPNAGANLLFWILEILSLLWTVVMLGSLLLPWKKAGRSYYDRIANTKVVLNSPTIS